MRIYETGEGVASQRGERGGSGQGLYGAVRGDFSGSELADEEDRDFLSKLYEETQEKISDELNHNQSLLNEYVEFTGIPLAEE